MSGQDRCRSKLAGRERDISVQYLHLFIRYCTPLLCGYPNPRPSPQRPWCCPSLEPNSRRSQRPLKYPPGCVIRTRLSTPVTTAQRKWLLCTQRQNNPVCKYPTQTSTIPEVVCADCERNANGSDWIHTQKCEDRWYRNRRVSPPGPRSGPDENPVMDPGPSTTAEPSTTHEAATPAQV